MPRKRRPEPENIKRPSIVLPPQQARILRYVNAGMKPKTIAVRLGILPESVREHWAEVKKKLGVSGRNYYNVIARARSLGLIATPQHG